MSSSGVGTSSRNMTFLEIGTINKADLQWGFINSNMSLVCGRGLASSFFPTWNSIDLVSGFNLLGVKCLAALELRQKSIFQRSRKGHRIEQKYLHTSVKVCLSFCAPIYVFIYRLICLHNDKDKPEQGNFFFFFFFFFIFGKSQIDFGNPWR